MAFEHELAIFVLRKEKTRLRAMTLNRLREHKAHTRKCEPGEYRTHVRATLNIMDEREDEQKLLDAAIKKLMS